MSGTLGGEWQPPSDCVNDLGCRLRARECWSHLMDAPSAPADSARITALRISLHPLVPCLATDAVRATQPR